MSLREPYLGSGVAWQNTAAKMLTCRASLPVVTAIVAVFVESKKPSRNEALALMCLTGGVCITIFEGKAMGNLSGLALAIAGREDLLLAALSISCMEALASKVTFSFVIQAPGHSEQLHCGGLRSSNTADRNWTCRCPVRSWHDEHGRQGAIGEA